MKTYQSFSSDETKKIGEMTAKSVVRKTAARVLALRGNLGAGKTTFVQGFFKGLGLKSRAPSPTFVLMRRHALRKKGFKNVFHVDAYRLKKSAHFDALGFGEIVADPRNIVLIEWPERARRFLPGATTWVAFRHGARENERRIIITSPKKR